MPTLRVRKQIEKMSITAIEKELAKLEAELRKLRAMVKAGGSLENPARIRQIRRQIARLLTRKHLLISRR